MAVSVYVVYYNVYNNVYNMFTRTKKLSDTKGFLALIVPSCILKVPNRILIVPNCILKSYFFANIPKSILFYCQKSQAMVLLLLKVYCFFGK